MIAIDTAPASGRAVCVGFSGGLDSSVLLHRLATEPTLDRSRLRALHVHHGLHADADDWAAHCRRACDAAGIALQVVRVQVPRDSGLGIEAAARLARREAFAAALGDAEVLALAHHRDDQAETFLMRTLRGSGVDGLAAMRPWQAFAGGWLWRPLLDTARADLRAHARRHGLDWIEDPSNLDPALDRGFLRASVLPALRARWPHADAALARSAALAAEAAALLQDEDARALALLEGEDATPGLPIDALLRHPPARRARLLRAWVATQGLPPLPARGIDRIEQDLLYARDDAGACFAWQDAWIRRWRGTLHAGRTQAAIPAGWSTRWSGDQPLPLPDGGTLELVGGAAFQPPVQVRLRTGGERIVLPGRRHSHALKQLLQETGIAPWERAGMPLLVDAEGQVLAAGDRIVSAALQDWLQARGAHLRWTRR